MKLGIDLVSISRLERLIKNSSFTSKIFTEEERAYFSKKGVKSAAASWAAKEAVAKALGVGLFKIGFKSVSLLHRESGKPILFFSEEFIEKFGNFKSEISISHEGDFCVAVAVLENSSKKIPFDFFEFFKRDPDTNKGDYGKLGIIAGSKGMTGAPYFSTMGAMRTGAGVCFLVAPSDALTVLQTKLNEPVFIFTKSKEHFTVEALGEVINHSKQYDAVILGPGLSEKEGVSAFVSAFIERCEKPLLIDADGLNSIKDTALLKRKSETVITPHPREFSRLSGRTVSEIQANRKELALSFAKEYGVTVVLKGNRTIVASPLGEVYENMTGNAGMATAGTGDVLSGIIGALLAKRCEAFLAAKLGVFLHGLAGDFAAQKKGETSLIASDLIEELPAAIMSVSKSPDLKEEEL